MFVDKRDVLPDIMSGLLKIERIPPRYGRTCYEAPNLYLLANLGQFLCRYKPQEEELSQIALFVKDSGGASILNPGIITLKQLGGLVLAQGVIATHPPMPFAIGAIDLQQLGYSATMMDIVLKVAQSKIII